MRVVKGVILGLILLGIGWLVFDQYHEFPTSQRVGFAFQRISASIDRKEPVSPEMVRKWMGCEPSTDDGTTEIYRFTTRRKKYKIEIMYFPGPKRVFSVRQQVERRL